MENEALFELSKEDMDRLNSGKSLTLISDIGRVLLLPPLEEKEISKLLICKLCKKNVPEEEYEMFCGMHTKCENESYGIREVQE